MMSRCTQHAALIISYCTLFCFVCEAFISPSQHHATKSPSSQLLASQSDNNNSNSHTIMLLDVYNILGHTAFSLSPDVLISRAAAWRDSRDGSEPIACVVDHGSKRCAHQHGPLADAVGIMFAGPTLTADDVIVSLVKERCLGGDSDVTNDQHNTTVVITADANLINRCQRQRREASSSWNAKSDLVFVEPASFLRELEKHTYADNDLFSGAAFDFPLNVSDMDADGSLESCVEEAETNILEVKVEQPRPNVAGSKSDQYSDAEDIIDAFMKETAVERTLNARSRLVRDFNAKTKRAGRNKSGGRNSLSNRQRYKLIAKQRRAQRHSQSKFATSARKIQSEKLREKLVAAGTEQDECLPVRTLLHWLAVPMDIGKTGQESDRIDASSTLLKWSAGATVDSDNDPLSSLLKVSRRANGPLSPDQTLGRRPLRAIVISDTHGFEAALSKLPNPEIPVPEPTSDVASDNKSPYLLPDADVLIHCGDFAANGSRMRQRESIRKLDSFFAHQTHIPHKIIVRGNHDPDTPGRILFKKSRALYATTPFSTKIDGVKFALAPFSRRTHAQLTQTMQNLANADVLISHEPPSGVLDLTYSGMRVGSKVLRHAVEISKTKPRAWLCGHIHEGRGAAKEIFKVNGDESQDATLVVNAANANFGKANRLVSGAVLLDIEHEVFLDDEEENDSAPDRSIESAEQIQVEVRDFGLDEINTRPGVRRRKGVGGRTRRR